MFQSKKEISLPSLSNLSTKDQLLFKKFGEGPHVVPAFECLHHAFEAQVLAQPKAVAVMHFGEAISYEELNEHANHLAIILRNNDVKVGEHVALFLQRSIPMIVGILAVLKVGAAYVPQHVGVAPNEQLKHILNQTSAKVILTLSYLRHLIPETENSVCLEIDKIMAEKPKDKKRLKNIQVQVSYNNVCFVLFTSGTTGKPNGVQVTHGNVSNIILTSPGNLGITSGTKVSQILSIAFDMAAWEILGCLTNGGTLVIRGKDIEETIKKVNVVIATPTILSAINAENCQNVKTVAVAGEPCPRVLADKWSAFATFYNSCGPTETTIVNTMQLHSLSAEILTIGKPTPNNTVYILNEQNEPCSIGEIGEMWAGGNCVSKGYLNNSKLTSERYKKDPFLGDDQIMFRTRDLGRWTADGQLEHFGRTDDQVKIRGFRVELDSVSAALETVVTCMRAVTLKLNDRNLVSFVSPKNVDINEAKNAVASALPYYCTPSLIIALDELPLTSNGKIDKRSLTIMAVKMQSSSEEIDGAQL